MKGKMIVLLSCVVGGLSAQTFTETLTREGRFDVKGPQNTVMIANLNGHVTVEGWTGEYVKVDVTKTISGKTAERIAQGKAEVQVGVLDRADTLIYYVTGVCPAFGRNSKEQKWDRSAWGYQWNQWSGGCELPFDFTMDFTVKVPKGVHVIVSTVNNGDIVVRQTHSRVVATNINGSISLQQLEQASDACTINGALEVEFARNPTDNCRFYALNGNVNAWFQKGLAANVSFESFHGELFSNVSVLETLPVSVEKESSKNGVRYKVNGQRYRIGAGGPLLTFETMNGNVYVKEK